MSEIVKRVCQGCEVGEAILAQERETQDPCCCLTQGEFCVVFL